MRAALFLSILALLGCRDQAGGGAGTRTEIRVVGSSTLYPFTTMIAERLVTADADLPAPVIESTGTGAGFRLFCAGVGAAYPDLVDASRRITPGEYRRCAANGAGQILEIQVGLDGIVVAESLDGPRLSLSATRLYRALAASPQGAPNRSRTWADIDPSLPATPIRVYGPPAGSGTRDSFAALILARGCEAVDPAARRWAVTDPARHTARCTRLRGDGGFIDAGENDNFLVQKLRGDRQAVGIFGYSYLEENATAIRGVPLDGIRPAYAAIADGRYPGARPLFVYAKVAHLGAVPGLRRFLRLYAAAWEPGGSLVRHGLIAAPAAVRARAAAIVAHEIPLDPRALG